MRGRRPSCFALAVLALTCALAGEAPRPEPLAVERALGDLRSGDWILQWKALRELATWKIEAAAPAIREVLAKDKRPWLRGRALVALAELSGDKVFDEVAHAARNGDPELRAAAVEALGIIGAARAVPAVTERLADKATAVRCQALVALARIQGKAAWDAVAQRLADEDPDIVRHAAQALGYVATPEATAKLIELLGHEHDGVRTDAARTLGRSRPADAILPLLRRMAADPQAAVRDAARKALASYPPDALAEPLVGALIGEETGLYAAALQVLALRPTRAAADQVAAVLRKNDPHYLAALPYAFDVLAAVDADAYLDVFTGFLHHENRTVRTKAVGAVARCTAANPFVLLKHCLTAKDSSVRYLAYKAMRAAEDKAPPEGIVAFLAEPLRSDDARTLKAALALLRERIARDDVPQATDALAPLLASSNREVRQAAVKAIEKVADDDARRRIAQAQGYLTDWMVLGPFPNDRSNKGFETVYPPEAEARLDFTRRYESRTFGYGARVEIRDLACGGERKRSLSLRPPAQARVRTGSVIVAYPLELPAREGLRLTAFVGLAEDAKGDGMGFLIRIGEQVAYKLVVKKPGPWQSAEVDLAAYAGRKITLELVADGLRRSRGDHAAIAEPRILAGDDVVADLLALLPKAEPRVAVPGMTDQLAWTPVRVARLDGSLELHDLVPGLIQYRTAYAVADVELPEQTPVRIWLHHDDGVKLWLNRTLLGGYPSRGEHHFDTALPAGRTRLLVKLSNLTEWWRLRLRITDPKGQPIEGLRQAE